MCNTSNQDLFDYLKKQDKEGENHLNFRSFNKDALTVDFYIHPDGRACERLCFSLYKHFPADKVHLCTYSENTENRPKPTPEPTMGSPVRSRFPKAPKISFLLDDILIYIGLVILIILGSLNFLAYYF